MLSVSILRAFAGFVLCLGIGVSVSWLWESIFIEMPSDLPQHSVFYEGGSGMSTGCRGRSDEGATQIPKLDRKSFQIISKPRPIYTDAARRNNVQGTVILRVAFLASGNIGAVEPIKTLPDGLTEQAIEAAKKIRFEPQRENGKPVSINRNVEYTFTIY